MSSIRLISKSDQDILAVTDVMSALRPQLNRQNSVAILSGMMDRGYHLLAVEAENKLVAACGYRFTEHLHWGKAIYIDDLSTLPEARRKGYARLLLDEIVRIAKENHCRQVHLDSGCGANRYDAHRLYLSYGFNITSHHFALSL